MSLRDAFTSTGVQPQSGIRRGFQTYPLSVRELVRVARLPSPNLTALEPDDPDAFHSFRENEAQGIVFAGGTRWFLSSRYRMFRYRMIGSDPFRPTSVTREAETSLELVADRAGLDRDNVDHIGDLAYANGLLFAPLRSLRGPHVIVGLNEGLRVVAWGELAQSAADYLCAVHPWNGLLYVMGGGSQSDQLEAYDVALFLAARDRSAEWGRRVSLPRNEGATIRLTKPNGTADAQGGQGVAFSANGRIYVTRALEHSVLGRTLHWHNRIYVYSALTGRRFGDGREWDFAGRLDEIEGVSVDPSGVVYVAVRNKNLFATDDFDLFAFRFTNLTPNSV